MGRFQQVGRKMGVKGAYPRLFGDYSGGREPGGLGAPAELISARAQGSKRPAVLVRGRN